MNKSFVKYLAALLLFGTNGIVASCIALESQEIVWFRTLFGSLLLVGIFVVTKRKLTCLLHKDQLLYLVLSGIAMAGGWLFVYEAYQRIGVSLGTLLYYCGPVFVMAASPVLFGERLTGKKLAGFAVVLVGLVLVNGLALHEGMQLSGIMCGVGAAVTYAVMVYFNKRATNVDGFENSMIQLVVALVVVTVYVSATCGLDVQVPEGAWPAILMLGLVNTGLGCYWYFSSLGGLPAQTVAVVGYAEPLSAVVFSVILLGEVMLPLQMIGAACIIGGAMFCELAGKADRETSELAEKAGCETNELAGKASREASEPPGEVSCEVK